MKSLTVFLFIFLFVSDVYAQADMDALQNRAVEMLTPFVNNLQNIINKSNQKTENLDEIIEDTEEENEEVISVPDTLMFSAVELAAIEKAIKGSPIDYSFIEENSVAETAEEDDAAVSVEDVVTVIPNLYLSAIMYYGVDNWTIWVNGIAYEKQSNSRHFEIVHVASGFVDLKIKTPEGEDKTIRIEPNQTYIQTLDITEEGKIK